MVETLIFFKNNQPELLMEKFYKLKVREMCIKAEWHDKKFSENDLIWQSVVYLVYMQNFSENKSIKHELCTSKVS